MSGPAAMAADGLVTAVIAPLVVLLTADSRLWRRLAAPAPVILVGFVALHTALTISMLADLPMDAVVMARLALLAGGVMFWLPVLGPRHCRISDGARSLYLYVAAPALDLSAVFLIGLGDADGGLAMITAMLPIGFAAMALTWRWITAEERAAQAAERAEQDWTVGPAQEADPEQAAGRAPAAGPAQSAGQAPASSRAPAAGRGRPDRRAAVTVTRRGLRIGLGLLWLSAAALQAQPAMFTARFSHQVLIPAAVRQPQILSTVIRALAGVVAAHPFPANAAFVVVQSLIGVGVMSRRGARPALAASMAWAAGVWIAGEGLGGLASGMGSVLLGAPGAALLYGLLAALAMPEPGGGGAGVPPPRWAPAAWSALWLTLLLTGPWPDETTGAGLKRQLLSGAGAAAPAPVAHLSRALASLAAGHPLTFVGALAAAEAFIALAALRPGHMRSLAALLGATVALAAWMCGDGMGGVTNGLPTDVGAGPPLMLLASAVWSCRGRGRPEPGRGPAGNAPTGTADAAAVGRRDHAATRD